MTNLSDLLQPYKERPQTSKLLADTLVTNVLGVKSKMTREERAKEREKLKEAKSESKSKIKFKRILVTVGFQG